jgi:hypothetical protein
LRLNRTDETKNSKLRTKQKELIRNKKEEKDEDDIKGSTIQNKYLDKTIKNVQPTAIDFSADTN